MSVYVCQACCAPSLHRHPQHCAEISMVMSLEDWGPIAPTIVSTSSSSQPQHSQVGHQQSRVPVGGGGGGREQWRRVVELLPCEFSSTSQPAVSANQTTWQTWRWGGKAREIQVRGVERRDTQFVVVETIDNLLIVMPIWVGEQGMTDACVCVCVYACMHVCMCVCVCACLCVCCICIYI